MATHQTHQGACRPCKALRATLERYARAASAAGARVALEEATWHIQQLARSEADQQQQQLSEAAAAGSTTSQQRAAAAQASKDCLMAVGAHIEGRGWEALVASRLSTEVLWAFVGTVTKHRLSRQQLASLYKAVRQQQQQQQQLQQQQQDKKEPGRQQQPALGGAACPVNAGAQMGFYGGCMYGEHQ